LYSEPHLIFHRAKGTWALFCTWHASQRATRHDLRASLAISMSCKINVPGTPLLMAQGAGIKGTAHEPQKTRSTAHRASEVAETFPPRRVCSASMCSRQSGCVSSFSSTSFLEPCGACTCPLHADGVPQSRDGRPPRGSNRLHGNVGSRKCGRAFPRADSGMRRGPAHCGFINGWAADL